MDENQITSLAKLLRENGDRVLNSEFKLTLSAPLVRALNDSFMLIADNGDLTSPPQSFQVTKVNKSKSDVFRDLQLVHDFVQKTVLLCLKNFPMCENFEGDVDISKFKSLRRLEVHKIHIKQITGIQPLRAQLQHLICNKSLNSVEEIITYCGGDNSNGFVWNELRTANFSYNNLKTVDSSLEFAQWIQNLTLSYNQLTSVEAIKWLPHLKVLDLRYNRLTMIPNFHSEASRRLQVLIMSNNFIEDLSGISRLEALAELDLSDNCLLDHSYLLPLSTLVSLRYLNLMGNPLECHPKHRQATATYLNKNTASVKFILDVEPLTKSEKALTGRYPYYHSALTARAPMSARSSGLSTPTKQSQIVTPNSSVGSVRSLKGAQGFGNEMTSSTIEKQKKLKVRTVEIEDSKSNSKDETPVLHSALANQKQEKENNDHLDTKKQIEDLREKYGVGWLRNSNVHAVQSVLGLKDSEGATEHISPAKLVDEFLNQMTISNEKSDNSGATVATSTPVDPKKTTIETSSHDNGTIVVDEKPDATEYLSALDVSSDNGEAYETAEGQLTDLYSTDCEKSESVSDPEDNEITYIVREMDKPDELFLIVSDASIKEKDILTRRTRAKWNLKILESCDRIKSNTLRINFDTIKKDKKERVYTVEEGLCQQLEEYLRAILSKRQLCEMNQVVYGCVNCSCVFSRERQRSYHRANEIVSCPECKKSLVVEISESPKVSGSPANVKSSPKSHGGSVERELGALENQDGGEPTKSASHSSIANDKGTWRLSTQKNISSAGSLNESSSCSKISNSDHSFDSNQSTAGSSSNDRSQDFNFNKNYESDVEILSNPSQSSIEVLDHPSRKTSEERKISRVPSLETIQDQSLRSGNVNFPDTHISNDLQKTEENYPDGNDKKFNLGAVNLTESSSSGSVTDSICTAYEQNYIDIGLVLDAKVQTKEDSEKDNKKEDSIISSMFGGLFQSTNLLMSRSQKPGSDSTPTCEKFKFNYNDFNDIDHRLKLYFYQSKFKEDNEHFKWLIKGKIYNENTSHFSEGLIVLSTARIYIMDIIGPENDDIQKWLKKTFSGTADKIESIQLLPWKIGLSFKIKGWGRFLLILQDTLRTDNLLLFFAANPLPAECSLISEIPEKVQKKISATVQDEQLKMFSILNECEVTVDSNVRKVSPACFVITDLHLCISNSNMSWLSMQSDADVELRFSQLMSNLVEIDKVEDNTFLINFLDEAQDKCELWKCVFITKENAESCLNAIAQSWEKLFCVPLVSN